MSKRNFRELVEKKWSLANYVCVGLDPDPTAMPGHLRSSEMRHEHVLEFFHKIIEATHDLVCAYMPNLAFFESMGAEGYESLCALSRMSKAISPETPFILDAKFGDGDRYCRNYAKAVFEEIGADAVTISPYMGRQSLSSFLLNKDKGVFVLARSASAGCGEFQDLEVIESVASFCGRYGPNAVSRTLQHFHIGEERYVSVKLFERVALQVRHVWDSDASSGIMAGSDSPDDLASIRAIVGDMTILIPDIGRVRRPSDIEKVMARATGAVANSAGSGFILHVSTDFIQVSTGTDFDQKARGKVSLMSDCIRKTLGEIRDKARS
jgi:orotidine-5'-phosphate decarboxylase